MDKVLWADYVEKTVSNAGVCPGCDQLVKGTRGQRKWKTMEVHMTQNHLIQKSVFLKLFSHFYSKIVFDSLILSVKTLINVFLKNILH